MADVSASPTSWPRTWSGSAHRHRSTAHQASAPSPASHAENASRPATGATSGVGLRRTTSRHRRTCRSAFSTEMSHQTRSRTSLSGRTLRKRATVTGSRTSGDASWVRTCSISHMLSSSTCCPPVGTGSAAWAASTSSTVTGSTGASESASSTGRGR